MSIRNASPEITFGSQASATKMVGVGDQHKRGRISKRAKRKAVTSADYTKEFLRPKKKKRGKRAAQKRKAKKAINY
jgi:hypothetical protein